MKPTPELPLAADVPVQYDVLRHSIDQALLKDRAAAMRLLQRVSKRAEQQLAYTRDAQKLLDQLHGSLAIANARRDVFGSFHYPDTLPVSSRKKDIAEAIAAHQVTIVAGETGSGKTTQIPKICAELGRGIVGRIGHTQPRRLAARTVAARIAEELEVELGGGVGYQFRFSEKYSDSTCIKVMTDGILLAEIQRDRRLLEYDTLIIDEAHERSLNIDFLLGYLKTLLATRADLKLIITSATIDVRRFSKHFDDAPVVEVSGRSFPVTMEYIEPGDDAGSDAVELTELAGRVRYALDLIDANDTVGRAGGPRDVLVFLPGEREIRDVSRTLKNGASGAVDSGPVARYEVLPLYARLSQREQQRIFATPTAKASSARRRVILATNVAETSVTVPGIGYVVDSGLARVSRYSARSKMQRLPIEAISKASANQRAGRCGRLSAGVCYRLYSEADFNQRPDFTEPELLRTNLASVILQMKALDLGDIEQFPFIENPAGRQLSSGLKTLEELGVLTGDGALSPTGKKVARLPVDPRLGRMLIAAVDKQCVEELLIIVSALAVQDPREVPADKRQAADQSHRRFWHKQSDFLLWINLWHYYETLRDALSQTQLRKRCKKEYLSYARMREWRDVHRQLRLAVKPLCKQRQSAGCEHAVSTNDDLAATKPTTAGQGDRELSVELSKPSVDNIHRALLVGLASNIGCKDPDSKEKKGEYRGARNLRFFLFPGSSQFKPAPPWVMAAEIVETRKVYARGVAAINPQWAIHELPHLVKHEYQEPGWDAKRGQVLASRTSRLYGLVLASRQRVVYETIDRERARAVFIEQALVGGQLNPDNRLLKQANFWRHNAELIEQVKALEEKLRRRDLLVDHEALTLFYEQRLPVEIASRRGLASWCQRVGASGQQALLLSSAEVLLKSEANTAVQQFPDQLQFGEQLFELRYCFNPGADEDGVTAMIPLGTIGELPVYAFDWLVPGMLHDKCVDMIKSLPKSLRKQLVPVPSVVDQLLSQIDATFCLHNNIPLAEALARQIDIFYRVTIDPVEWRGRCEESLDNYCRMRFVVLDGKGLKLQQGRCLPELVAACRQQLDVSINNYAQHSFRREGLLGWDFGELAESHDYRRDGATLRGIPALIDKEDSVTLDLLATPAEAYAASRSGIIRLFMLAMKDKVRYLKKNLCQNTLAILPFVHIGNREQLVDDLIKCAVAASCLDEDAMSLPRTRQEFDSDLQKGQQQLISVATDIEASLHRILENYQQLCEQLQKRRAHFHVQCEDIDQQLKRLICPGFLLRTGAKRMQQLPRYLRGMVIRLERLSGAAEKDAELCEKLSSIERPLESLLYKYPEALFCDRAVADYRWLLEELRVSLFAQQLKTPEPVSIQRVVKAWNKINHNQYPASP